MQTRFRCATCGREWAYTTTPGVCLCGAGGVETVRFTPPVPGLDSTTTVADLPRHVDPILPPDPHPALETPNWLLMNLGERL
jgi:hypothetical protein